MKQRMFHFLINPVSGGGEGHLVHGFLPEIMSSLGFTDNQWVSELTEKDSAFAQALNAVRSAHTVIAVGGDGTVSTVLSARVTLREVPVNIGLIPLGTGNDLARVLNLYDAYVNFGLVYLVRRLVQAETRDFDLWMVNDRYVMANYFSCGLDARIAHDFNRDRAEGKIQWRSAWGNKIHYARRFFKDRRHCLGKVRLRYKNREGEWFSHDLSGYRTVIIGNIPSFASGSNPFLESNMADGVLEIVPVPSLWRFLGGLGLGGFFVRVFLPNLHAVELVIEMQPEEYVQLDGEDLTGKLGSIAHIRHAMRIQILSL